MLTLLETVAAIKAIDTPKDILYQAYRKVMFGDLEIPSGSPEELAEKILNITSPEEKPKVVITALVQALAATTLSASKPGSEGKGLELVIDLLINTHVEMMATHLRLQMETSPLDAMKTLNAILRRIAESPVGQS